MALVFYDRIQQTGTANTTVSFTLSATSTGYQSFAAVGNGNTTYYSANDGTNWEVGIGTYSTTGPTLTRTTILSSSNSGSAVTFTGTVTVFCDYPAGKAIIQDASSNTSIPNVLTVGNGTAVGGATNPIEAMTGASTNYVQAYIVNNTNGTSSSADLVAYPSNGTDAHGWTDMGITSLSYADTTYTVTGPNESYLFGSAPSGSGTTGNLVYATDSTGSSNAHQFYVGGFTQAKSAWKAQIDANGLSSPQVNATNGLIVNSNTVSASYSIPSGSSAMSAGPMTVASGKTVTIPSGSRWVIL